MLFIASSIVASMSARTSAYDEPPAFAPAFNAFLISHFFKPIILVPLVFFINNYFTSHFLNTNIDKNVKIKIKITPIAHDFIKLTSSKFTAKPV